MKQFEQMVEARWVGPGTMMQPVAIDSRGKSTASGTGWAEADKLAWQVRTLRREASIGPFARSTHKER